MIDLETSLETRAITRATHTVTLTTYNTAHLTPLHVYRLVTPYAGPYYYNVLNLGPATVYIRADDDPDVGDPESETLPGGNADNMILVPDGPEGLRFLAGEYHDPPNIHGAVITVRLVRG